MRHTDSDSSELERIWKEVIMVKFKVLCWRLPGGPEESNKPSKKNSRDLNHGYLEYVTVLLSRQSPLLTGLLHNLRI